MIEGNREHRRAAEKYLREQNKRYPPYLVLVPRSEWPERAPPRLETVLRSRTYLVQIFLEDHPAVARRLSVNRTAITPKGGWRQDIPWEDLQRLKREAGYGDMDAVEVFPSDHDVVNVASMRHLFVLTAPLPFAWRCGCTHDGGCSKESPPDLPAGRA